MQIPKTMQAMVYRGINDLRIETVPVPSIGANDLLVKVAVCGVCPTDIKKIQYGTVPPPRIFGHETAGTIVKIGQRVKKFHVGDRVGLHHHVPCLKCHVCRHGSFAQCETYKKTGITAGFEPAGGGFAEYVRVMPFVFPGIVKIPPKNSFLEGAMLEPVNTVLKAINRLNLLRGDYVFVAGQGPIGLMFTRLLALRGIKVIVSDLLESRLKLGKKFGARHSLNANEPDLVGRIRKITGGRLLDAAIVAVPSDEALLQAQRAIRGGGRVMAFAHTRRGQETGIDLSSICVDEKELLGSYSSDFTIQRQVARLVFSRK
ncbi:MAG: alcohol dehydrogenase catalytic domain-containing protein, partial [Verrucomicrobiota bacterium]